MQKTRQQILDHLKLQGSATLEELAAAIGLAPATLRMHLNVLGRERLVRFQEVRGKVGRPAYHYSLTSEGEALFPRRYDSLAARLLSGLERSTSEAELEHVFDRLADSWAEESGQRLAPAGLGEVSMEQRLDELVRLRAQEGGVSEWERTNQGYLIHEYNCASPSLHDERHRVCAIEERYLARLLDARVERVACRCDGDRPGCTYLVTGRGAGGPGSKS